ncbi:MAG: PLP-dependent transferase, partial [Chloroflexota bacterium]
MPPSDDLAGAGFTTRVLHTRPRLADAHGALRTPVYDTAAFEFGSAEEMQLAFEGRKVAHAYSRSSNPTVEDFELRVTALAGALGTIAVASGMAAVTAVVLALAESGANIVTTRTLFGNTASLIGSTLVPWGLETRYADMDDPASVEALIDERTALVFLEAIANPQMAVADIPAIVDVAGRHGVPVVVDGTGTTPYLLNTGELGVAIEVISSTKYISGGATSIGGLIIDNGTFDWGRVARLRPWFERAGRSACLMALRRNVYRNTGGCMAPHNAYLQALGLETLALRIDRTCANALELAARLAAHPAVTGVGYPGLPDAPAHATAARLLGRGFGGILTFELADRATCFRAMDALRLVRRATNVNDNKSLIIHPASTIYADFTPEERAAMDVPDTELRLSVGIEDVEDVWADLTRAIEA